MKPEFLVEFLPPELRRQTFIRAARRRSTLLIALMLFLAIGVSAHSWNLYRKADIDCDLSMKLCQNSAKVDGLVDQLAADQQNLTRFMGVYDRIATPLDTSDLVATLTHIMPERMSLAMVKFELEGGPAAEPPAGASPVSGDQGKQGQGGGSKPAKPAKPAPVENPKNASKDGKDAKKDAAGAPAPAPKRWMNVTLRGFAASNADLYDFERRLSRTKPLEEVRVYDNQPTDVPGSKLQEWTITCRIPLNARYEQATAATPSPLDAPGSAGTAGTQGTNDGASPSSEATPEGSK